MQSRVLSHYKEFTVLGDYPLTVSQNLENAVENFKLAYPDIDITPNVYKTIVDKQNTLTTYYLLVTSLGNDNDKQFKSLLSERKVPIAEINDGFVCAFLFDNSLQTGIVLSVGNEWVAIIQNEISDEVKQHFHLIPYLPTALKMIDWLKQLNVSSISKAEPSNILESIENELKVLSIDNENLFIVKSGSEWIEISKNQPIPRMLFSELWFEGEVCILFADTNLGKSILAVQIGDSISRGKDMPGFKLECEPQKVLYFDFELSGKQFENRYSINYQSHYIWDSNFLRCEINPDSEMPEGMDFEKFLNYSLEQTIIKTNAKILIIDNLTYLKNETEKAKDALPLMKYLKELKRKYGLSILTLAHTPKRDLSKPITRNDLSGSKMLINFCDSAFSIGESHKDKSVRYIKQIKARNTEFIFDGENVALCQVEKPSNFLRFELFGYGKEIEHLKPMSEKESEKMDNQVIELKKTFPDLSNREIARKLNTNAMKVGRILKKTDL